MNNADTKNLMFDDLVVDSEAPVCIAFTYNHNLNAVRFLTGRFTPNRLGGQVVWFPLIGDTLSTVMEVYKCKGITFHQMDWSRGEPYFGILSEIGFHDFHNDERTTDETVTVLKAIAAQES